MKQKIAAALLTISLAGITQLKAFEGTKYMAYQDQAKVWTICTGSTYKVMSGMVADQAQCALRLKNDLGPAENAVRTGVKVPITQQQYDVLTSFAFNVGARSLLTSTLLKKLNAGDCLGASNEFNRWVRVSGYINRGLMQRRATESKYFKEDC